jgi:hypothetical protein
VVVSFEEVKDMKVDDCVVIISDVSEEMTCFFIAEPFDVVDEPCASFLAF